MVAFAITCKMDRKNQRSIMVSTAETGLSRELRRRIQDTLGVKVGLRQTVALALAALEPVVADRETLFLLFGKALKTASRYEVNISTDRFEVT